MSKKIIITSQLLLLLFVNTFSQSDTTVCIDFNPDLNQKARKNIISLDIMAGSILRPQLEISYERILKENKTIKANIGGYYQNNYFYSYKSFHFNLAYRHYFSNRKYAKTKVDNNKYYIRKQQKTMLSPKGLYVGPMTYFNISNGYWPYNSRIIIAGIGGQLGYQFLFFNRIAMNTSIQIPLTIDGYYYLNYDLDKYEFFEHYSIRPRLFLNLSFGYAF